jgi:hypothetical protein
MRKTTNPLKALSKVAVRHTAKSVKPVSVKRHNTTVRNIGKESMRKTIANLTYSLGRKPTKKELLEHNHMEGGAKRRRSSRRRS